MNQIKYREIDENTHAYSREFNLTRDFTLKNISWVVQIAEEHMHHQVRVGYESEKGLHDLLNIDSQGSIQVTGVKGTVNQFNLEQVLSPIIPTGIPVGNKLYIEATGICESTKSEAEELLITYAEGIPKLLSEGY